MELTQNIFKTAYTAKKCFVKLRKDEQEKILKILLWNCEIQDNKITNFRLKEPYSYLQKTPKKGDFDGWQATTDDIRTYFRWEIQENCYIPRMNGYKIEQI